MRTGSHVSALSGVCGFAFLAERASLSSVSVSAAPRADVLAGARLAVDARADVELKADWFPPCTCDEGAWCRAPDAEGLSVGYVVEEASVAEGGVVLIAAEAQGTGAADEGGRWFTTRTGPKGRRERGPRFVTHRAREVVVCRAKGRRRRTVALEGVGALWEREGTHDESCRWM